MGYAGLDGAGHGGFQWGKGYSFFPSCASPRWRCRLSGHGVFQARIVLAHGVIS
ncbi:hypothetical protein C4K40_5089 [Pseudomonas sp. CMR5c]|nr:hypothetical protein C4K40_5089 [Pseudomonas sp. CMR5c]